MQINDRNGLERARLSDFSESILGKEAVEKAIRFLLPIASVAATLFLVALLMGGIKLSSLLVVLAFSLAFIGTRHS